MVDLTTTLRAGLQALEIGQDSARALRLIDFIKLIEKWNRVYNLTAVHDPVKMIPVHLLDSLSVLRYIKGANITDVGSGAGIPGIPLAIYQPDKQFVLVDSDAKKTRFMQQAVMELSLTNVRVCRTRVEDFPETERFDTVICRAFSNIVEFVNSAGSLCKQTGRLLALKGKYPGKEIAQLPTGYEVVKVDRLVVLGLERQRHVVEILKV